LVGAGKGAALAGLAIFFLVSTPLLPAKTQTHLSRSYLGATFQHFAQQIIAVGRTRFFNADPTPTAERTAVTERRGA
jgi:hypothetical protein